MAMQIAAEIFPIRYVCGFGENLPDGVVALDDLLDERRPSRRTKIVRERQSGRPHVALVTFDVTADGLVPVARNHAELIAGGLAALLEGGIDAGRPPARAAAPRARSPASR